MEASAIETWGGKVGLHPPRRLQRGFRCHGYVAFDVGTLVEGLFREVLHPLAEAATEQVPDRTRQVAGLARQLAGSPECAGQRGRDGERLGLAGDPERAARDGPAEFGIGEQLRSGVVAFTREIARGLSLQGITDGGQRDRRRGHDRGGAGDRFERRHLGQRRPPFPGSRHQQVHRPDRTGERGKCNHPTDGNLAPRTVHGINPLDSSETYLSDDHSASRTRILGRQLLSLFGLYISWSTGGPVQSPSAYQQLANRPLSNLPSICL
jgi:hypothetical protein